MPIYELHCNGCDTDFEVLAGSCDDAIQCSHCGSTDTHKYISLTTYRHADHWMKNMMSAMHKSQERDKLKKELKAQTL
ncbi:zinc ribbon domain-containing protein [Pseudodesulfovibrio sp. JC047]|uniref:FmdB family zinc ribbon protein n=1 Tax=Pseudodesulfovibrio sp. JC047 TaxID=2683199 RepID=UPI0013D2DA08|nr:zinc ribbon domain-containing protein [Pseudodesulfovibrio sp. JC047]NDV19068.1 zinc ribbon domain-containing protein [Pseudodesulfovibrio sp. JC047]